MELLLLQEYLHIKSLIYLIIFILTLSLTLLFILTKLKKLLYCNCSICSAYVTASWHSEYTNLCDWYTHLLRRTPSHTINVHVLRSTITADPKNVEYVLRSRFENYPKGKAFSAILGDFLGQGIFNVDGDTWRFQRKLASFELGKASVLSFAFDVVRSQIELSLLPRCLSGQTAEEVVDLQDVFRRFSFDCICRFSFGLDPRCLGSLIPMSEFEASFDLASRLSAERAMTASPIVWKIKRFFDIGSEKELKKSIKVVNVLATEVIRQRRKLGDWEDHRDLLSRFMESIKDEKYLRDIVISFLLAGRDTVASALTSFIWLISNHPQAAEEILAEADHVIGPCQNLKSSEQLRELHYLQAAVYESMRLFPPIQFDSKFCVEDDVLPDGTHVKKGTRVTYHPYAMGRMESIWGKDCMEFKPERWLRDGVFLQESPYKYPVFQAGLRVCLGKEMALLELKCVALSILRRFRVRLAHPKRAPRFSPGLTATFRDGLPVFITERSQAELSQVEPS